MTEVYRKNISLDQLVRNYATAPAKIFGLVNKGEIAVGKDADLVLVSKTKSQVKAADSFSKAAWSPYEGLELLAAVEKVILGGFLAYDVTTGLKIPRGKILSANINNFSQSQ